MPTPDFTFDISRGDPNLADLVPLYGHILGSKVEKPTVSLGPIKRAAAVAWLRHQHDRYAANIGKRSGIINKMLIEEAVELVDVTDDAP